MVELTQFDNDINKNICRFLEIDTINLELYYELNIIMEPNNVIMSNLNTHLGRELNKIYNNQKYESNK